MSSVIGRIRVKRIGKVQALLATYVDPTPGNYPVCLNPPSALAQAARYFLWTRRFYGSEDQGTRRWHAGIVFNDHIFNEVCQELSE